MGKNLQGGNRTKGMARKTPYQSHGVRIPESEEEKYAIVRGVSGNGRFRVETDDKKVHVGIVPGSMRGHKKRNNYVQMDTIVIINDRSSWQTVKDNGHVDIVYVYEQSESNRLGLSALFQECKNVENDVTFQNTDMPAEDVFSNHVAFVDNDEIDMDLI